jgi:hypothetical protein
MRTFIALCLWCLLLVLCWPLAIALLVLFPIVWIVLLPFTLVGLTLGVLFRALSALFLFPFRILRSL